MTDRSRRQYLARNKAALVGQALRMSAQDSHGGRELHGVIDCPVCGAPLHYTNSKALGKATGHCKRNDCLSVIGELPAI